MKRVFLLALLASCGSPKRDAQEVSSPSQELKDAAESVYARLLRCPSGLPGKTPCSDLSKQSDSLGQASYFALGFPADESNNRAVQQSVDDDGRPWRSPEHRAQRHGDFSRDHVISLALWSLGVGDGELISRVVGYASRHDWRVCDDASRCLLTPGVLSVLGDVVSVDNLPRPYGTNIPATVHEHQISIEAASQERCDLVLDKVYIKAKTAHLTRAYVNAAKACAGKVPLWGEYVRLLVEGGDSQGLTKDLTAALKDWQGPTSGGHWTQGANGWALVGLAKLIEEVK